MEREWGAMAQCRLGKMTSDERGYNMIEMVCVIVIVALLAVLIIPGYIGMIGQAKKQAMVTNARAFYIAAQAVATEKMAEANADYPYTIPDAEDIRKYVASDEMFDGVTKLTIFDYDKNGTIDAIYFEKDGDSVRLNPGDKVLINGSEAPLATPTPEGIRK